MTALRNLITSGPGTMVSLYLLLFKNIQEKSLFRGPAEWLATKAGDLSLISETHMVEGERRLLQDGLWPPPTGWYSVPLLKHRHKNLKDNCLTIKSTNCNLQVRFTPAPVWFDKNVFGIKLAHHLCWWTPITRLTGCKITTGIHLCMEGISEKVCILPNCG